MTFYALISPQGHTEYNAEFVLGEAHKKLEHDKWYTNQELAAVAEGWMNFLKDASQAVENNIKKWRYEIQR